MVSSDISITGNQQNHFVLNWIKSDALVRPLGEHLGGYEDLVTIKKNNFCIKMYSLEQYITKFIYVSLLMFFTLLACQGIFSVIAIIVDTMEC